MLAFNNYLLLLSITIVLTIFSIYYYMKLIKHIFFEPLSISNKNTTFFFVGATLENSFLFFCAFLLLFGPILLNFTTLSIFFSELEGMIDFSLVIKRYCY